MSRDEQRCQQQPQPRSGHCDRPSVIVEHIQRTEHPKSHAFYLPDWRRAST
jgi:hypothetical protein